MTRIATLPGGISYRIKETTSGWLLTMQNAHCTFSQIFRSSTDARHGVSTSASALESLTKQHLSRRTAAAHASN